MDGRNSTNVSHFILMGLTDSEEIQLVLFILFLLIYLTSVLGNAGMILIIRLDLQLHTPMYFFLSHLSLLDLIYSNVITPKTLENLLTSTKYISYISCFAQMFFFVFLGTSECLLLSSCVSYLSILSTVLKITSTSGKQKAFSTCASHLLGVTIFYGTTIFTYLKPHKSYSLGKDQVASVFYTIVIPMLNPLIYSLRNKEVKNALIRVLQKTII
ncbi:PREDICTED: olfactory receptor 8H1-like [Myotis davidii]|uniref:olfactory receptor 8H1-like n=1 Tax=Myotis davidii TaxID=225400 RepID=UPI000767D62F|nr:PREDICTED: olfactory receptor 8H1-like [Myotis davidii]